MSDWNHTYFTTYRFWVEIDGLLVGSFSEVSGLESETEYETYEEGGVNSYSHRIPKRTKYPHLVLKRGMTDCSELWDWYEEVVNGKFKRKSGSIIMEDVSGKEKCRWNFYEAYPSKWTGPSLNATSSDVSIETLELVHNGLKTIL
ncbi:phage tail protein [Marinicrinis sediminis]|uniref:Phage tail protein n=1 Tax=Marinicrinis sediminis TaxID=1652465 RepID=A0ABW5REL2_9BACL